MDGRDGGGSPDAEAVVEDFAGYAVAFGGAGEEVRKIDFAGGESAIGESAPFFRDERESPAGGFRFGASLASAGAAAAVESDGSVSCEDSGPL